MSHAAVKLDGEHKELNTSLSHIWHVETDKICECYCDIVFKCAPLWTDRVKTEVTPFIGSNTINEILFKPLPSALHAHQTSLKYVIIF